MPTHNLFILQLSNILNSKSALLGVYLRFNWDLQKKKSFCLQVNNYITFPAIVFSLKTREMPLVNQYT